MKSTLIKSSFILFLLMGFLTSCESKDEKMKNLFIDDSATLDDYIDELGDPLEIVNSYEDYMNEENEYTDWFNPEIISYEQIVERYIKWSDYITYRYIYSGGSLIKRPWINKSSEEFGTLGQGDEKNKQKEISINNAIRKTIKIDWKLTTYKETNKDRLNREKNVTILLEKNTKFMGPLKSIYQNLLEKNPGVLEKLNMYAAGEDLNYPRLQRYKEMSEYMYKYILNFGGLTTKFASINLRNYVFSFSDFHMLRLVVNERTNGYAQLAPRGSVQRWELPYLPLATKKGGVRVIYPEAVRDRDYDYHPGHYYKYIFDMGKSTYGDVSSDNYLPTDHPIQLRSWIYLDSLKNRIDREDLDRSDKEDMKMSVFNEASSDNDYTYTLTLCDCLTKSEFSNVDACKDKFFYKYGTRTPSNKKMEYDYYNCKE